MSTSDSCTLYRMRLSFPYPRGNRHLNENFVFDLRNIFKECNPCVKQDLPVFRNAGK
jgi:hypothetical protein